MCPRDTQMHLTKQKRQRYKTYITQSIALCSQSTCHKRLTNCVSQTHTHIHTRITQNTAKAKSKQFINKQTQHVLKKKKSKRKKKILIKGLKNTQSKKKLRKNTQ